MPLTERGGWQVIPINRVSKLTKLYVRKAIRRLRSVIGSDPDTFLKDVKGVIHIGANYGQERTKYDGYGLNVLWIEAIPDVFEALEANVRPFPRQRAVRALITDREGAEYDFHVSNNEGASSSIFDFKEHAGIWPEITHERTITLRSTTLVSLVAAEDVDLTDYDALVIDTQGSELLVLHGARQALHNFRFIKLEVADFEAYAGCCQMGDVRDFMTSCGYVSHSRRSFAEHPDGGTYYDVVYRRVDSRLTESVSDERRANNASI